MIRCAAVQGDSRHATQSRVLADGRHARGFGRRLRIWAPDATAVSVRGTFNSWTDTALARGRDGTWSAFMAGVTAADQYKFFVTGAGSTGYKRDPYARSLTRIPAFPNSNCEIRAAQGFSLA